MKYTITVFGLGFVGLTTALAFAEKGNKVYGYDIDGKRREFIEKGELPFVETGLDSALTKHINKNFIVVDNVQVSVKESDFIFLCVGTPCKENGEADLKYIYSVIDMISSNLNDDKHRVIVIKSTVPPSTTAEKVIPYLNKKGLEVGSKFTVANNPEFLREGHCWDDMINSDRIICGVCDKKGEEMLLSLYENFNIPFYAVSLNTGEFIKYLSNTLLATMISYSNEMSKIADIIGDIQIKEAFKILHMDKRWKNGNMSSYVYPGCGYGGYCLPKDTQAMYEKSKLKGYEPMILKNVMKINNDMPKFMADKIMKISNKDEKIGILGLSFKPGSDDVRDSSSAKIIKILLDEGYNKISAYDPIANKVFSQKYNFDEVNYYDDIEGLCSNSDILVLATAWDKFKHINEKYSNKKIIDCRYFL
ncbi:nucleotide sugar dehydrogenase [Clostridium sporogenes]|uniref:UDP-glucose 6-dehydrogenase n=1 Tax=Clostridium botulinum TaxID=1491 RepID=A0A6M0SWT1_CLOBO|nr:nucleotide sugar dehydrogenase [Clostridium sporogenes]NFA59969.1 UDP-glucose/GDP-mannose dehydrogenase family protein [Clostridium botulinum]NFI73711.1 UDP-glucose/GDP-mannose dehydrogenase family protein [Clostridium sporogenes]NFL72205.1 UDP-glucose/GDP-mannose dehydrogenase family protein [Clostridium sporogenes]NFM23891.1 UDP-glucose/GDP-mannose dehydrogenase family protein [Clostridium sporogenes]NFP61585.1 UDP-glucose/GDP-mannose dehydrogenase family protein [Clostridium sporogenes]